MKSIGKKTRTDISIRRRQDCEEINELNEEGLLNNNIALQADINGKDIHFELRNDAGEKLEKTIPEDELQKYIVGYEFDLSVF